MNSVSIALLCLAASAPLSAQPRQWEPVGAPLEGFVGGSLTAHDDGGGVALYAGGATLVIGQASVFRFQGASWSPVGGVRVSSFETFATGSRTQLYCGVTPTGKFPVPIVQVWDGVRWSEVGGGIETSHWLDGISDLAVYDDGSGPAVYAGGAFYGANGANISRWRGTGDWQPVGTETVGEVFRMHVFDDGSGPRLYVVTRGSQPRFWRWDGSAWQLLPFTANDAVHALAAFDDGSSSDLYAAGAFTSIGGVAAPGFAKWDGQSWSPLTPQLHGTLWSLTATDGSCGRALYLGGELTSIAGVSVRNIARLTTQGFEPLGDGREPVYGLTEFDDGAGLALYAIGRSPGTTTTVISRWPCEACYPDCDQSTGPSVLDIFDFLCFQDAFVTMDPYADCDNNTTFDIFDFLCFQDAFVAGCS